MPDETMKELPDDSLVCFCSRVHKGLIVEAIRAGTSSVKELQETTGAGIGNQCKELNPKGNCCHPDLKSLIEIYGNTIQNSTSICIIIDSALIQV